MLFEFSPSVPGRSLKCCRDRRWQINENGRFAWLEFFGFEIDWCAADASRQVDGILSKDGRVNCASGKVTTRRGRMRAIAIIKIDIGSCFPHLRPGQANRRHQRVSRFGGMDVGVVQRCLIDRCGFASPRKIKDRRRVVFADFIGPEFRIRTKYLVASYSRLGLRSKG